MIFEDRSIFLEKHDMRFLMSRAMFETMLLFERKKILNKNFKFIYLSLSISEVCHAFPSKCFFNVNTFLLFEIAALELPNNLNTATFLSKVIVMHYPMS